MAAFSKYMQNKIINMLRGEDFAPPTEVFMGLFNAAPTMLRAGAEVPALDYERQPMEIAESVSGGMELTREVRFPTAQSDWGKIEAIGLFDDAEGGNLLVWDALVDAKPIGFKDAFSVPVGAFDIRFVEG